MAEWLTVGMDNMGLLHLFEGRKKIHQSSKYIWKDSRGRQAGKLVQNDVEATLEQLGLHDFNPGDWEQVRDPGYFL